MDVSILEKIGLTKNQTIVYLSLLKLGSSKAQSIVKESGLHSSRVYACLENLEQLGFVSFVVKDFKKYFQAVNPDKLLNYLDEQKEAIKQIMPDLKKLEGMQKEEINASIYKGKEGIKSILSLVLKENKDVYILGAKGIVFSELKYFMPNFEKLRIKRKIRFIKLYDSIDKKGISAGQMLSIGKALPKGFESNSVVWIFGDKIAIMLWKEEYPSAFLINKRDVADSFRKWFNLLYQKI